MTYKTIPDVIDFLIHTIQYEETGFHTKILIVGNHRFDDDVFRLQRALLTNVTDSVSVIYDPQPSYGLYDAVIVTNRYDYISSTTYEIINSIKASQNTDFIYFREK